jgi:hypothetical protein
MRRALLTVGLGLLALSALAPALEALGPCPVECVPEAAGGDCAGEQCCSCCVHTRLVKSGGAGPTEPLARSSPMQQQPPVFPPPADPRDILHVPRTSPS